MEQWLKDLKAQVGILQTTSNTLVSQDAITRSLEIVCYLLDSLLVNKKPEEIPSGYTPETVTRQEMANKLMALRSDVVEKLGDITRLGYAQGGEIFKRGWFAACEKMMESLGSSSSGSPEIQQEEIEIVTRQEMEKKLVQQREEFLGLVESECERLVQDSSDQDIWHMYQMGWRNACASIMNKMGK